LTFRDKCPAVCWQRQLRDRYAAEGAPPVPHLDVGRSVVRPVSRRCAAQIILKYEWLGTMAGTSLHYGIFFGAYCAGVCCVAVGGGFAGNNVSAPFGLRRDELAMLCRGACVHWAPSGTNSRLVAWTCRLLARGGAARLIIAYSDTDAGEVGTIYQACGWAYVGLTASTRQWLAPTGRLYDQMQPMNLARQKGGTRGAWKDRLRAACWREQDSNPKHRYCRVLDTTDAALVARVEAMRQPCPKRAGSADSGTPALQAGRGGATPTPALSGA
jgi:hypothetical protein